MERVEVSGEAALPLVVVDYAHTPDALRQALASLLPWAESRRGQLWCVVGCGGDRDRSKRPLMAQMAQRLAGRCVFTSDNPRTESPAAILQDMVAGLSNRDRVEVIENRREALAHAIAQAHTNDVVLLAGKGHETTQEIQGVKHPFADLEVARELLRVRVALKQEVSA
jgi:UDP-N-acetylmuramyl tripeptide synthase